MSLSLPLMAINTDTYYDKEKQSFITEANFKVDLSHHALTRIVADFANYNRWALDRINGESNEKSNVLTHVNSVKYLPDEQWGSFLLNFDLQLIWPLGHRGATINYQITNVKYSEDGKLLEKLTIALTEKNFTTREFILDLEFSPIDSRSGVEINFTCRTRLAAWLDIFFSLKRYRHDIEWRLVRVAENLQRVADNRRRLATEQ
ncbi:MAG: hypothetical protein HN730_09500 [Bdellovibrionales bacterium]|nr:hypothetical protein [Bdellovibrionales bacterium]